VESISARADVTVKKSWQITATLPISGTLTTTLLAAQAIKAAPQMSPLLGIAMARDKFEARNPKSETSLKHEVTKSAQVTDD
jgi:hypothetical protein